MWASCSLGDQLAIAKETGRRLGMGTNMYPSSSLLGQSKDAAVSAVPVDELIEKADGFAGVFPGRSLSLIIIIMMVLCSITLSVSHLVSCFQLFQTSFNFSNCLAFGNILILFFSLFL